MLLLPIASFHLVMYVAQKEEFDGAKSKKGFATSGSDGKDAHCDLVARTQQTDIPENGRRRFLEGDEKLVSSDGVGVYSTGWSPRQRRATDSGRWAES